MTGEEAAARAAAEPVGADVLQQQGPAPKKKWYRRRPPQVPGMYPPRVFKPQLYPPDVKLGPGGLNVRMPQFRGPQVQGPSMGSLNAQAGQGHAQPRAAGSPARPPGRCCRPRACSRRSRGCRGG